jgi:hypothetical protein
MARADGFSLPHHPFKRFVAPSTPWTFLTGLLANLLHRTRTPSLQRMSHEWLLSNERELSRREY